MEYRYTVDLTLQAPVLSQDTGGRPVGVDTAGVMTGASPALPGTLIKGNLREAWTKLGKLVSTRPFADMESRNWLGTESPKAGPADSESNQPRRARLRFDPFWKALDTEAPTLRHRIARDPETGAVERGALQVIAAPHASGRPVIYRGEILATVADGREAERLALWIRKGLEFVPALGAFKGVGFGRVLKVEVTPNLLSERAEAPKGSFSPEGFGLLLLPDRPFCFAKPQIPNSNRYESEDFIPGAAIKGALAERLEETGRFRDAGAFAALYRNFDRIRITHALPALLGTCARPPVLPFSLVVDHAGELRDVALKADAGLIGGKAPTFQRDWKDKNWKTAGLQTLARSLIVRTAIDEKTGAPRAEQLFARNCIDPEGFVWLADVDLSRVGAERAEVGRQLREALVEGLFHLGKTKAQARVECLERRHGSNSHSSPKLRDGKAILVLQTPARLLADGVFPEDGTVLAKAYAEFWSTASGQVLEMAGFFAAQTLAGGAYLHARFGGGSKGKYRPRLLTDAGSVFVLKASAGHTENEAETVLRRWLETGLPQPDTDPKTEHELWRTHPWLAVNGYGEIAVNLPLHWDLEPKAWEPIDPIESGEKVR